MLHLYLTCINWAAARYRGRTSNLPDFYKYHRLGNDYIVIDPRLAQRLFQSDEDVHRAARTLCDHHTGIGSDGILVFGTPSERDFSLRIFNPDGSEAEKSGNGVSIFASFLREYGYASTNSFTVATLGGDVPVTVELGESGVAQVFAEVGVPTFGGIERVEVEGEPLSVTTVSLGNPHCVVVVKQLEKVDLARIGPLIENHSAFPERTNVQFVEPRTRTEVQALVWERGAGVTRSSGTSSCAIAAACYRLGLTGDSVDVIVPGGTLHVNRGTDGKLSVAGPVEPICAGEISAAIIRNIQERVQ